METRDSDYLADKVADLILQADRVVVFTGAGVSTESGIPDFRSPGGIWSRYDPDEFTIQKFLSSPESRKKHWQMLTEGGLLAGAEPNPAHYAIAELEKLGNLDCVITQNVDNLHQKAGNSPDKVFELHGNMRWVRCLSCDKLFPIEDILQRLELKKEDVPDCEICHGILKPDAVFFGEALPQKTLNDAIYRSRNCDFFIVIGSTLVVYPAAYMPMYAKESGAKLVIINLSSTPMDSQATVLIRGKAGEAMAEIMEKVRSKLSA
ncbi:MAG TPA: NAD-dependent deacylase [Dehalococcoidia bacterium]|nr:NAD-dependent deacylase [Dehalococcoidia bacterium]